MPAFIACRRTLRRLLPLLLALSSLNLAGAPAPGLRHTFALGTDQFPLHGQPFQMISGELHCLRLPREAWRSRLKLARAMGLAPMRFDALDQIVPVGVFESAEKTLIEKFGSK